MMGVIQTARFGDLKIDLQDEIIFPEGLLGFPECRRFCLVDTGDQSLILWFQSLDRPEVAFPVLEPQIFKPDYVVRLSAVELRILGMNTLKEASVFSILTIGSDITQMSANLKAPLVMNHKNRTARQVVLQENEYSIKHPAYKGLRERLISQPAMNTPEEEKSAGITLVPLNSLNFAGFLKAL